MNSRNHLPRIGGVVLAAGASTRLGSPKQLIVHEGVPLVRRAAIAAVEAGATPVVVVLGADASQVEEAVFGLPGVSTVVNREWTTGLASSLAAGLQTLLERGYCDAVLVMLADQPFVDAPALKRLLTAFNSEQRIIASAYDNTIGVPAVFGIEHLGDLLRLEGDAGAGAWLRSRTHEVTAIPLGSAALDIDTQADVAHRLR